MSFESCWKWKEKAEQALFQTGLQLRHKRAQKTLKNTCTTLPFSLGIKGKALLVKRESVFNLSLVQ